MKKINFLTMLITMVMAMVATPAWADWGSENVTMSVGETKTLYLPSSITNKTLKSVTFYSASYQYVQVEYYTNYSVKVKALKAISTPVIVRCDYYYYINNGGYIYQNSGAYDFNVTVVGETEVKPDKVDVQNYLQVPVGESKAVSVTVTPPNAVYTLSYKIYDTSIAEVSNGVVFGKKAGETDLKVWTDNGKYDMCRVIVTEKKPTSIDIPSSLSLEVGKSKTLTPTVVPSDASYSLTWASSKNNVATVSQSGVVTAKAAGSTIVTVKTDNGKTDECLVTVTQSAVSPTSVSVSPSSLNLEVNQTVNLTATVYPNNATTSLTWSTSNSSVAKVSNGNVTAVGIGTCKITVKTSNGKTASCTVTVKSSNSGTSTGWSGTYSVTSSVDKKHVSDYNFPSSFTMKIKQVDGTYYVTEMLGLDLTHFIYEGIKLNMIDNQHAELDLDDNDNLGGYTTSGNYLDGLYMISPRATYQWGYHGKLNLTRNSAGSLIVDDFYVFTFGGFTGYEAVLDAVYHNVKGSNTSSSVPSIIADEAMSSILEIYNLNGVLVYSGGEDGKPELAPGIYVFRRGGNVQKVMVR